MPEKSLSEQQLQTLHSAIQDWGKALGFQQLGVTDVDLSLHEPRLEQWLANNFHGEMEFMARHGSKRSRPELLVPGTIRVISARMDYLPDKDEALEALLEEPTKAYISRYALGRDYHKLMRKRLAQLADKISAALKELQFDDQYRAFVDSAPVLERGLAEKSGLGWIGKNSMLINSQAGSWFFLGEIYTNVPLPVDTPQTDMHCGTCTACIEVCPTGAIVDDHVVDSRKCISYLTIELKEAIPEALRKPMGNRIYGCDDCQIVCPWNKFAESTGEQDFHPRHNLQASELIDLFSWDENTFLDKTEGSAIRRIGFERWQRNVAVALGNAPFSEQVLNALCNSQTDSAMVQEHIDWAISQQQSKQNGTISTG